MRIMVAAILVFAGILALASSPPAQAELRISDLDVYLNDHEVTVHVVLLGVIPAWPHSRRWGYGPSGGLGLVVLVLLILLLTGRI